MNIAQDIGFVLQCFLFIFINGKEILCE